MFDLQSIQAAIKKFRFDGWLLYDFRGSNVLALRVLGMAQYAGSRRFLYYVPAEGEPRKLVHQIESGALDHLPGESTVYLRWQDFEAGIESLVSGTKQVAMEYSPRNGNPYVSKVDAGIVEIVQQAGVNVRSSGDLIQYFEARWTQEQWELHLQADRLNQQGFEIAWKLIADEVRSKGKVSEMAVQDLIMQHFADSNMTTYHPPIVGVNGNGGDPHYEPTPEKHDMIREGDFVLIDSWAKMDLPNAVYSDLTKTGFVGTDVPEKFVKVFDIVAAARDAGIECVTQAFADGRTIVGGEIDDATRNVIEKAGYGETFCHRTGHNIGQETHGNGAHIDNLETREDRSIMRETCFSIEPGIYLPDFGVRSEIDVFIDSDGRVHVTGGIQTKVVPILADY